MKQKYKNSTLQILAVCYFGRHQESNPTEALVEMQKTLLGLKNPTGKKHSCLDSLHKATQAANNAALQSQEMSDELEEVQWKKLHHIEQEVDKEMSRL